MAAHQQRLHHSGLHSIDQKFKLDKAHKHNGYKCRSVVVILWWMIHLQNPKVFPETTWQKSGACQLPGWASAILRKLSAILDKTAYTICTLSFSLCSQCTRVTVCTINKTGNVHGNPFSTWDIYDFEELGTFHHPELITFNYSFVFTMLKFWSFISSSSRVQNMSDHLDEKLALTREWINNWTMQTQGTADTLHFGLKCQHW